MHRSVALHHSRTCLREARRCKLLGQRQSVCHFVRQARHWLHLYLRSVRRSIPNIPERY